VQGRIFFELPENVAAFSGFSFRFKLMVVSFHWQQVLVVKSSGFF
jgi:hypothetical protein